MEYVMGYGWSIIVVIVVGIVMWQLGVFEASQNVPTTSTGFVSIKPVLVNCKIHNFGISSGNLNGFGCQFHNLVSEPIDIVGVDIKVNGEYCAFLALGDNVFSGFGRWTDHVCTSPSDCGSMMWVPPNWVVSADGFFTIGTDDNNGIPFPNLCDNLEPNDFHQMEVDIAYKVQLGEVETVKHSIGALNMGAE